ncbi:MAG: dephospho-CoA kinase [bacterium]
MISVAVTGGIGSGKSTLVAELARFGAVTLDADRVGWTVLDHAEVRESLLYAFGAEILADSGEIDRRRLAARAFRDADATETLNAILHPPILAEMERWLTDEATRSGAPVAAIEASVILEAGGTTVVDYVVVVVASEDVRLARLADRGVSRGDALARMQRQWSDAERARYADYVIANEGAAAELAVRAAELWQTLITLPSRPRNERGRARKDG